MFHLVLVRPQIPPNTGNVIRLCANTGCILHLIEPLGFALSDKHLRRAGLDYHEYAQVKTHPQLSNFFHYWQDMRVSENAPPLRDIPPAEQGARPPQAFALTTKGSNNFFAQHYRVGDAFVFGCETAGLSDSERALFVADNLVRLPMRPNSRSLNLANSVAVVAFEACRQAGFSGLN